jgi:predicted phosphodiesterase
MFKEHKELFSSIEHARTRARYYRGNHGKEHSGKVKNKKYMRPPQKSGWEFPLPPSLNENWIPETFLARKTLIFSDVHIPFHDSVALNAMIKFALDYAPNLVIMNGDIADFYELSRFIRDPRKRNFADEIKTLKAFLEFIRERFKKAEIVFKTGNHEERWQKYLYTRAPAVIGTDIWEYSKLMDTDKLSIKIVQDKRIIMLGELPVIHGHEFIRSPNSPVNPARGIFLKGTHTAICGHWHQVSSHSTRTLLDKPVKTWSVGCLCGLHPEWARINNWSHGFATVDSSNGSFNVNNYSITNGVIM